MLQHLCSTTIPAAASRNSSKQNLGSTQSNHRSKRSGRLQMFLHLLFSGTNSVEIPLLEPRARPHSPFLSNGFPNFIKDLLRRTYPTLRDRLFRHSRLISSGKLHCLIWGDSRDLSARVSPDETGDSGAAAVPEWDAAPEWDRDCVVWIVLIKTVFILKGRDERSALPASEVGA